MTIFSGFTTRRIEVVLGSVRISLTTFSLSLMWSMSSNRSSEGSGAFITRPTVARASLAMFRISL